MSGINTTMTQGYKCEHDHNGHCLLNECIYGDFLLMDDSRFNSGRYCYATCDEIRKAKETNK